MSSSLKALNPSSVSKPLGKYSHGMITTGKQVHLAGQLGQDPATGKIVEGGIEAQTKQAINNIEAILREAGTDLSKIISRRTYFMNIHEHLGPTGAEWAKRVGESFPAATAIQVTGLALKDALLEIEIVAEIP